MKNKKIYLLVLLLQWLLLGACSESISKQEKEKLVEDGRNGITNSRYSSNHSRKQRATDIAKKQLIDNINKKEYAKAFLQVAANNNDFEARNYLRKLNNKKVRLNTILLELVVDEWKTTEGPFVSKLCNIWRDFLTFLLTGSINVSWWEILLLVLFPLFVFILFFVWFSQFQWMEYSVMYNKGNKKLIWVPIVFIIYGLYACIVGDLSMDTYWNLGRFTSVDGFSSFFASIAIFTTWVLTCISLYTVYIIVFYSPNRHAMIIRLLNLFFLSILAFSVGVIGSIIIAIVIVYKIATKTLLFEELSSDNNFCKRKVECSHKTISGGCDLNNGWGCAVEEGSSICPYDIRIN